MMIVVPRVGSFLLFLLSEASSIVVMDWGWVLLDGLGPCFKSFDSLDDLPTGMIFLDPLLDAGMPLLFLEVLV